LDVRYKCVCKNCGVIFLSDIVKKGGVTKEEFLDASSSNKVDKLGWVFHNCENGETGISDIIALKIGES
jgi:hypothetical protein